MKFIKILHFIIIISSLINNCGETRYRNTGNLKLFYHDLKLYEKNKHFEISFACDQWYYSPELFSDGILHEDDCIKYLDKKIEIIGEINNSFIGYHSDSLFIFSPKDLVKKRIYADQIINQNCENVLYTYTRYENYKNSNKFLRSNYKPEEFLNHCFELHSNLHFMKKEIKINEYDYIFNIRSNFVYLTFNSIFDIKKDKRFILKVLGSKEYLSPNGIKKYPHYLAFQIE